jgi:F0F1-type ATP synthase membrane subunit b/b'
MGQIGNYLKDATLQLDDKIAEINTDICVMEATVKQMDAKIENFATSMDTIVNDAQKHLNQARLQAEHHMNHVAQKMENMNTTLSETCQYFESKVKSYCKKEEEDLRETISEAIVHLTQEAINEHVNTVLHDHLEAITLTAHEAITELKKESLKCSSSTTTPSQKLPPTPWSQ